MNAVKFILFALLLSAFALNAQAADNQSRIAIHSAKWLSAQNGANQFGLAGWSVIPNILDKEELKNLTVIGPTWKHQHGWVEMLVGQLNLANKTRILINARTSYNIKWLHYYGEGQYFLDQKTGLATIWLHYPLLFKETILLKAGLEANSYFNTNGGWVNEYGPNFSVPLSKHVTITTASLNKDGKQYTRMYITLVF